MTNDQPIRAIHAGADTAPDFLGGVLKPPDWHAFGLCREVDPEEFFPEKGGSTRPAKQVCQRCCVQQLCLEQALATGERFGIWGGASEPERREMLKQRRREAA